MAEPSMRLRVGDAQLTSDELTAACARYLEAMARAGAKPGDIVAVETQPSVATCVALVGNLLGGYVSLPLEPGLGVKEREHIERDAQPRYVVVGGEGSSGGAWAWQITATLRRSVSSDPSTAITDASAGAASGTHLRAGFRTERVANLEASVGASNDASAGANSDATHGLRGTAPLDAHASAAPWSPAAFPRGAAAALLLYTSGTTGAPKGARLSRDALFANLADLAEVWALRPDEHIVHALPLFHVHGLVLGLFGGVFFAGGLDWLGRFEPRALLSRLAAHPPGASVLYAVPTMYTRMLDTIAAGGPDAPELAAALARPRLCVSGSAPLPLREHQRMTTLVGRGLVERYGMTETLISCAVAAGDVQPGRVGKPLPTVELELRDEHGQLVVADDEAIGEIHVRGPALFAGYLGHPAHQGWFATGDMATQRADGSIRIVGRKSTDIIKCGGYKAGAGEVEASLLDHPWVAEAAVVGVPDPDLGQRICAAVVLSQAGREAAEPAAELMAWVASQLSAHKRPREIWLRDALPRNPMGKVQKAALIANAQGPGPGAPPR